MSRELLQGTKLNNRYIIEGTLGRGGFGVTYKAMDTLVDVPVAIKEYENSTPKDQEVAKREVKMAARFYDLQGITSARDFFVVDSVCYIVMEYVEGISIKNHVNLHGTINGRVLLQKMKPIMESLCIIHKEGVIHRDISPDNIMITKRGNLQLIDFGEARNFEEQKKKSLTLVYKRGYAPVEQCRQQGKQGAYTDVYALCATIYFALTGIVPDDAIERMIADHLKPLEEFCGTGLTDSEVRAIEKGLDVFPENRFQSMEELYEQLYEESQDFIEKKTQKEVQGHTLNKRFNTAHVLSEIDGFYQGKEIKRKKKQRLGGFVLGIFIVLIILVGIIWRILPSEDKDALEPIKLPEASSSAGPTIEAATPTPTSSITASPKPEYKIGSYTGLKETTAKARLKKLQKKGLTLRFQKRYSKVPKGRVIAQSIDSGTVLSDLSKTTLILTVSKGKKVVKTPRPTSPPPKQTNDSIDFDSDLDKLS